MTKTKTTTLPRSPIPLLILLLGALLMFIGFYTATSNDLVMIDFRTVSMYPFMVQVILVFWLVQMLLSSDIFIMEKQDISKQYTVVLKSLKNSQEILTKV